MTFRLGELRIISAEATTPVFHPASGSTRPPFSTRTLGASLRASVEATLVVELRYFSDAACTASGRADISAMSRSIRSGGGWCSTLLSGVVEKEGDPGHRDIDRRHTAGPRRISKYRARSLRDAFIVLAISRSLSALRRLDAVLNGPGLQGRVRTGFLSAAAPSSLLKKSRGCSRRDPRLLGAKPACGARRRRRRQGRSIVEEERRGPGAAEAGCATWRYLRRPLSVARLRHIARHHAQGRYRRRRSRTNPSPRHRSEDPRSVPRISRPRRSAASRRGAFACGRESRV